MCLQHVASGFLVEAVSWDVVLSGSTFRLGPSHYTHFLHICGVAILHTLLDSWTTWPFNIITLNLQRLVVESFLAMVF